MINNSVTQLYNFLYNVFYKVVSPNVYVMRIPTELRPDDAKKGFIVIKTERIEDESEFLLNTYGHTRVNVIAFIPPRTRGRVDLNLYSEMEEKINDTIRGFKDKDGKYMIDEDSILGYDDYYDINETTYNLFIKSFKVIINN